MEKPMPRFGVLTNPFMNLISEIKEIHKLGFDYVEIGIETPGGMPEIIIEKKKKILSLLKKFPSPAIGHTGWIIDLGTPYDEIRKAWISEGKRYIDTANELGIKIINFHGRSNIAFFEKHGMKKDILNNYVKSLRELVEYGKKKGIWVMLENMFDKSDISTFEDYKYIMDKVKDLGVHIDISHAFVIEGMKGVRNFVKTFKDRILHIHFSDSLGFDDHLPIGRGIIEYEKVVKLLKKIGYDKTITFEVFVDDRKHVVSSREKIKKMWRKF